ncbi:Formin-like protein 20 [Porphyridium purpureum]|uniref:Formin-like protein 20 n=1 Tax=Porphyridium purpureum TaxID=35688 RepID=A0A5J4Z958_PORPP|nr:Formin-like protein 20 [Porphyridium purpureum]|eukprot:POR9678..scf295_1
MPEEVDQIKLTRRRDRQRNKRLTLEERLSPEVIKRLEAMAHEFVRFERNKFGFYIDPARYAVKQRSVGPLGQHRRRKVVAGVDKDGNVITAWVGVQGATTRNDKGEIVSIPRAYEDGATGGGGGGDGDGEGGGGGGGGGKRRRRKKKGDGDGSESGSGSGSSWETDTDEEGGGGKGKGGGGGGGKGKGTGDGDGDGDGDKKKKKKDPSDPAAPSEATKAPGVNPLGGPDPAAPPPGQAHEINALNNEARGRKKKPLHWQKIPNNLLKTSFWPSLDQTIVTVREDDIDELFGVEVKEINLGQEEENRPEVLPHKRKHNINILLANVKMTPEAIHDMIRNNEWRTADPGALQALLLVCPTPEEETMLKTAEDGGLRDKVDRTDKYMMELAEMKGLRGKILCALSALTFNDEAVEIIRKMDTFALIPQEVMSSRCLNHWLVTILAIGNFLNSGTPKGGCLGFKLEGLAMLNTIKDSKGNTLLDYIYSEILRDAEWAAEWTDMPTLHHSADISLDGINEDVQALLDSVQNVNQQIASIGSDAELAAFKTEMEAFAAEAMKTREEIMSLRGVMSSKCEELMGHFGERNKNSRARQEDVLRMLREFDAEIKAAAFKKKEKEERDGKAKKEKKEDKKKDKEEKKKKKKKDKGDGGAGEGGAADEAAPPPPAAPGATPEPPSAPPAEE